MSTLVCDKTPLTAAELRTPGMRVHLVESADSCAGVGAGSQTIYETRSDEEIWLEVFDLGDGDVMGAGYIVLSDDYFDPARPHSMVAHRVTERPS